VQVSLPDRRLLVSPNHGVSKIFVAICKPLPVTFLDSVPKQSTRVLACPSMDSRRDQIETGPLTGAKSAAFNEMLVEHIEASHVVEIVVDKVAPIRFR